MLSSCYNIATFICCCGCLVAKSCPALLWPPWTVAHQASLFTGFPGKNIGVNCHFLLQENFLTQGSNVFCIADGATWEACFIKHKIYSRELNPKREKLPVGLMPGRKLVLMMYIINEMLLCFGEDLSLILLRVLCNLSTLTNPLFSQVFWVTELEIAPYTLDKICRLLL